MSDTEKITAKLDEIAEQSEREWKKLWSKYGCSKSREARALAALGIAVEGLRELERITGRYHEFVTLREKAIAEALEGKP